jgi:nicotinamidase-related amidase
MLTAWEDSDLTDSVLVEIDFQEWIIRLGHDPVAPARAVAVRERMERHGRPRICTRYLSADPGEVAKADPESAEARFDPRLAPRPDDAVITKHERDVFSNPELRQTLRHLGARRVVLTGIATDAGVQQAAESALKLGYAVTVVADACGGTSIEGHESALRRLAASGAIVVATTAARS